MSGDDMYRGGNYSTYTFYGSGTGTPSASDTSLFHHEGAVENSITENGLDASNRVAWITKYIQLSETTAVGVNLTEVGLGYGTASNNLCTHAMLQDMNGNPISILKSNTDIINIYATIYVHWSSDNYFANFTFNAGDDPDLRKWVFGLGSRYAGNSYWIFDLGKEAAMRRNTSYNTIAAGYYPLNYGNEHMSVSNDVSNKRSTWTFPRIGVNDGNINGGLGCMFIAMNYVFNDDHTGTGCMMFFDLPAILGGTDITSEAVGTGDGSTTEYAFKFDYPSNVTIYKNGVRMSSGYTIKNIPAPGGSGAVGLSGHFRVIHPSSVAGAVHPSTNMIVYNGTTSALVYTGTVLYNRAYEVGVASLRNASGRAFQVYASEDLEAWTKIYDGDTQATVAIAPEYQYSKYFKVEGEGSGDMYDYMEFNCNSSNGKALMFDTAPANGDVITADYHSPYIAKDADHVFDLSITWQFGEYHE